ncbi:MAG: hypothetical protein RSE93_07470 [Oscillospiraceae bacterium]
MVKEYFYACEEKFPEKRSELRRISLALRREGILSMEVLCQMQKQGFPQMAKIRNIGEKATQLILSICEQYEEERRKNK